MGSKQGRRDQRLPTSIRRLTSLAPAVAGLIACVLALQAPSAGAARLNEYPLVPYIVGGQESSISQFPWQVFVLRYDKVEGTEAACGGSILDATHILTAAHCVDHAGNTTTYPAGEVEVLAGASNVSGFSSSFIAPTGSQVRVSSRIRTDPYYTVLPEIKDDVAVLELSAPLELSAAANAQPIALVATGATPAPGTVLSLSGYGKQDGAENAQPNGGLYSTTLTAISSDACRGAVGVNSAVLLCALSASSSGCEGDSGGPLTEGNPAVEVGVVDFGGKNCPAGQINGFTNVAAPEVRAFIEGSESPPVAPRPTSPPVIRSAGATPVDFSPLTCEPGTWSGSPSFTYTFQVENASAQALQSAPTNVFAPPSTVVGASLVCIVQASNPGGVSTYRSATSSPIALDTAPPVSSIVGLKCHLQACTLSIAATDPNSVALGVQPWVTYTVTTKCPVKKQKKKGKRPAKRSICHETPTVHLPVSPISAGLYRATATRLPYNERITFTGVVTNAAGLRPARLLVRSTTLHPPAKKKKKSRKH